MTSCFDCPLHGGDRLICCTEEYRRGLTATTATGSQRELGPNRKARRATEAGERRK